MDGCWVRGTEERGRSALCRIVRKTNTALCLYKHPEVFFCRNIRKRPSGIPSVISLWRWRSLWLGRSLVKVTRRTQQWSRKSLFEVCGFFLFFSTILFFNECHEWHFCFFIVFFFTALSVTKIIGPWGGVSPPCPAEVSVVPLRDHSDLTTTSCNLTARQPLSSPHWLQVIFMI